jgi:transcriptional regulator with XRE-family HTH domain
MRKSIRQPNHRILLELLRTARLEAKLTQEEVALRLSRPQSFVSKYESGERRLDLIELREICLVLGITLPQFSKRFDQACQ